MIYLKFKNTFLDSKAWQFNTKSYVRFLLQYKILKIGTQHFFNSNFKLKIYKMGYSNTKLRFKLFGCKLKILFLEIWNFCHYVHDCMLQIVYTILFSK